MRSIERKILTDSILGPLPVLAILLESIERQNFASLSPNLSIFSPIQDCTIWCVCVWVSYTSEGLVGKIYYFSQTVTLGRFYNKRPFMLLTKLILYVLCRKGYLRIKFTNFLLYNPQVLGALIANDEPTMSCLIRGAIIKSCVVPPVHITKTTVRITGYFHEVQVFTNAELLALAEISRFRNSLP